MRVWKKRKENIVKKKIGVNNIIYQVSYTYTELALQVYALNFSRRESSLEVRGFKKIEIRLPENCALLKRVVND